MLQRLSHFIGRQLVRLPKAARWAVSIAAGLALYAFVIGILFLNSNLDQWLTITNPYLNGLVAVAIGLIAGIVGNVVSERYSDWQKSRLPSVETFFRNHDLTVLVGQSLAMVLFSTSEQLEEKADRVTVHALAQSLELHWPALAGSAWASQWLATIKDDQLVAFIQNPQQPALTNDQVAALFRQINPKTQGEDPVFVNPVNATRVHQALISRFGEALRQGLKRDFANDGQAAMAMILDICGALLNRSLAELPDDEFRRERVDRVRRTLRTEVDVRLAQSQLKKHFERLNHELDNVHRSVREEGLLSAFRDRITHHRLAWLAGGICLVILISTFSIWFAHYDQNIGQEKQIEQTQLIRARLEDVIAAVREQPRTSESLTPEQRYNLALNEVAFKHDLTPQDLRAAIDAWTAKVKADPKASPYDLALAEYKANHFDQAAEQADSAYRQAMQNLEKAKQAGQQAKAEAIKAAILEGDALVAAIRYDLALTAYRKAAALTDKEDDPVVWAKAEQFIANTLHIMARYDEAEPLLREALAVHEHYSGENHRDTAIALNNLAQLLQDTNRLVEAEPLMRRALAIDEASFGQDHPDVARDLNNLATLLQATNRLVEAEPLRKR